MKKTLLITLCLLLAGCVSKPVQPTNNEPDIQENEKIDNENNEQNNEDTQNDDNDSNTQNIDNVTIIEDNFVFEPLQDEEVFDLKYVDLGTTVDEDLIVTLLMKHWDDEGVPGSKINLKTLQMMDLGMAGLEDSINLYFVTYDVLNKDDELVVSKIRQDVVGIYTMDEDHKHAAGMLDIMEVTDRYADDEVISKFGSRYRGYAAGLLEADRKLFN